MERKEVEQDQEIVVAEEVKVELTEEELAQVAGGLFGVDGTHN